MLALVAMLVVIIAILFGNRSQFDFSCHRGIITYFAFLWYNWRWKGGRVVEGTGLENQRWKHPQVRILSFPPKSPILAFFLARSSIRRTSQEENTNLGDFKLVGHVLSAKNRQ